MKLAFFIIIVSSFMKEKLWQFFEILSVTYE